MFDIEKYLYLSGPIQFKSTLFKGKPYLSKTKAKHPENMSHLEKKKKFKMKALIGTVISREETTS